jgi:hypothetical protein
MSEAYIVDECYEATDSPEMYANENACEEGEEFALLRVTVISRSIYRVVNGKPIQVAIAFPEGGTTR